MTLRQAQQSLRLIGMTIRLTDGEYRVTERKNAINNAAFCEAIAYYTSDLSDAVATGVLMARKLADTLDHKR